jgi:hypothetical protein
VAAIVRLVAADEDTVRDVIHAFNAKGLAALDPRWAGGRPRLISDDDTAFIVTTATTRPVTLRCPFTRWSLRKLVQYLARCPKHGIVIGRERLRQILRAQQVSFQWTRTWKESRDPEEDAKLDRIEHVTSRFPDRCFAFDQFGPWSIRTCHRSTWARETKPARLPATAGSAANANAAGADPPRHDPVNLCGQRTRSGSGSSTAQTANLGVPGWSCTTELVGGAGPGPSGGRTADGRPLVHRVCRARPSSSSWRCWPRWPSRRPPGRRRVRCECCR